ncbi:MAG: TetR/AcrR family transcriptional regulator; helix-turn-helix transcriptional regulator [Spirochaetales bacterium]|nr:TetR/AcrR family transcriptional regulator; helix-turn-helix transcriptional regulator [Spirochaetales bacterium]MCF7938887.1 TetR/AcrR family transcriptional regulator; helix-turn-helix transcriptional regulator [Spirochaetales bacterium]
MSIQERKERERRELRKKILDAASEIVSQEGHENLTIRKLARMIEYSPRTIYLHFQDKDDLLRQIVEEGFRRTLEMRATESGYGSGEHLVERRLRSHIETALANRNYYRAVVSILFDRNYEPGPAQREIIGQTRKDIAELLPEDKRDEETVSALSMIVFSSIRGFTISLLNLDVKLGREKRNRMIDRYIRLTLAGLRSEADTG